MKQRKQCKQCKPSAFGAPKTPAQLAQDRRDRLAFERMDKRHGVIGSMQMWLADRDYADAHPHRVADHRKIMSIAPRTQHRGRGEGSRSSAASGDGNSSDDSDSSDDPDSDPARPLRPHHPLQLLDQQTFATLLCVSTKTLQNWYSASPHSLPPAIQIPGARGPRWTAQAVQNWLDSRPAHTAKPSPAVAKQKRRVGRPRIAATLALVGKGGAA